MITNVSFDVWNTLIRPNPRFSEARNHFLAEALNLPVERVEAVYKKLKSKLDKDAEEFGVGLSSENIYKRFMFNVGREEVPWRPIRAGLEELFRAYPPLVLEEVLFELRALQKRREDLCFSIASNTNFIRGDVLSDTILDRMDVLWGFKIFSDVFEVSKPNPEFWANVIKWADNPYRDEGHPTRILHIGDNKICDGGCVAHGIEYAYVAGPHELPQVLREIA